MTPLRAKIEARWEREWQDTKRFLLVNVIGLGIIALGVWAFY